MQLYLNDVISEVGREGGEERGVLNWPSGVCSDGHTCCQSSCRVSWVGPIAGRGYRLIVQHTYSFL